MVKVPGDEVGNSGSQLPPEVPAIDACVFDVSE